MKKLLILTAALVLAGTTQVFAQEDCLQKQGPCPLERMEAPAPEFGCPCRKMHKPPFDMQKLSEDLQLTKKQQEQLNQLKDKEKAAVEPIKEQIKVKKQQIEDICNEKLTVKERQEKLEPVHKEIKELKNQIREIRMQGRKDFEALLTDKQMKKLEQLKSERRQEFRGGRGHKGQMHKNPPMGPKCGCGPKHPVEQEK